MNVAQLEETIRKQLVEIGQLKRAQAPGYSDPVLSMELRQLRSDLAAAQDKVVELENKITSMQNAADASAASATEAQDRIAVLEAELEAKTSESASSSDVNAAIDSAASNVKLAS